MDIYNVGAVCYEDGNICKIFDLIQRYKINFHNIMIDLSMWKCKTIGKKLNPLNTMSH